MVETDKRTRRSKPRIARTWGALISPWLTLRRKTGEVGLLYAAHLLFQELVPRLLFGINILVMIEGDLSKRGPSSNPDPGIRWATLEDLGSLSAPNNVLRALRIGLESGQRAAILERGGELIGYNLYATDACDLDNWMLFRLSPKDVWTSFVWVARGHRGHGIHASLSDFAVAELIRVGYTRYLAIIEALNRNSLNATWKVGDREIGRIFFVRVLGFTFLRAPGLTRVGWWSPVHQLEIPAEIFNRSTS